MKNARGVSAEAMAMQATALWHVMDTKTRAFLGAQFSLSNALEAYAATARIRGLVESLVRARFRNCDVESIELRGATTIHLSARFSDGRSLQGVGSTLPVALEALLLDAQPTDEEVAAYARDQRDVP